MQTRSNLSPTQARWPARVTVGAAAWSAAYFGMGSWWLSGGGYFPFGAGPLSGPAASIFAGVSEIWGAGVVMVLSGGAVATALMMLTRPVSGPERVGLLAYGSVLAVLGTLVVPDARAIAVAAYGIIFLVGAPFGLSLGEFFDGLTWPIVNQYLCLLGGILWGATTLAYARTARGACVSCGRRAGTSPNQSRFRAQRIGIVSAIIAAAAPLPYAATRLAWALGIPIGIDGATLTTVADGSWFPAGALALVVFAGSALTIGLIMPWGETFPRWVPWLHGRRVPVMAAVIPAGVVALLAFAAGFGVLRDHLSGGVAGGWSLMDLVGELWVLWGISLGVAAIANYYRRRERCRRCGQG